MLSFLKNSSLMVLSSFLGGFFLYLIYLFLSCFLSIEDFSEFMFFSALIQICWVPAFSISLFLMEKSAFLKSCNQEEKIEKILNQTINFCFWSGIILFFVLLFFSGFIFLFFSLDSFYSLLLTFFIGILFYFIIIPQAVLQGLREYFSVAIIEVISNILRFVFITILVFFLPTVFSSILGFFISIFISIFISYFFLFSKICFYFKFEKFSRKKFVNFFSLISSHFWIIFFITILLQLDILLARYFLNSIESGLYAALSVLAKSIVFLGMGMEKVMLSEIANKILKGKHLAMTYFLYTFLFLFLSILIYVSFFHLFGNFIVKILDEKYWEIKKILSKATFIFGLFLLISYLSKFLLLQKASFLYPCFLLLIFLQIFFVFFATDIDSFLNALLVSYLSGIFIFLINFLNFKFKTNE